MQLCHCEPIPTCREGEAISVPLGPYEIASGFALAMTEKGGGLQNDLSKSKFIGGAR